MPHHPGELDRGETKRLGGKRTTDAVTGPQPGVGPEGKFKFETHPASVRAALEITGSLLQDVSIPSAQELEEGNVELFLGGDLPSPAAIDPQDAEVNKFLSGGK